MATNEGYETFIVPDDVGGRYSVLTAVGLLPIATAGINIEAMMIGAAKAREELSSDKLEQHCIPICDNSKHFICKRLYNRNVD